MKKVNPDEAMRYAKYLARRSPFKKYCNGAVLVDKRHRIISGGWSHKAIWQSRTWSVHAELHAITRGRHLREHFEDATIYIATMSRKSGNYTNAAPCLPCGLFLRGAGIETAVVTVSGGIRVMDLNDLTEIRKDYNTRNAIIAPLDAELPTC